MRRFGLALLFTLLACGGSTGARPDAGLLADGGDLPDSGGLDCASPTTACGAQCVDLSTDPASCGRCGHSCQGGACQAGACQPVMLASGEVTPSRLAVEGGWLYWSSYSSNAVKRIAVDGGVVQTLAAGMGHPLGISADSDHVYWLSDSPTDGGAWEAPLDGGAPLLLAADRSSNTVVRIGSRLYWGSASMIALQSLPLDGGTATTWPTPSVPTDITTDGRQLYFGTRAGATAGGIFSVDFDGGSGVQLASGSTVVRLAVANGTAAWIDTTVVNGVARDAGVFTMLLDGGAARRIASLEDMNYPLPDGGPSIWSGLAADDQYVYWTDIDAGAVFRAPWDGGAPEAIATAQEIPVGVAVDSSSLYWSAFGADGGGRLLKLAK